MPVETIERVTKREASLTEKLAKGGESMDAAQRRRALKRLKRSQRKRRRLTAEAERLKPKKAKEAAE